MDGQRPPTFLPRPPGGSAGVFKPAPPTQPQAQAQQQDGEQEQQGGVALVSPKQPHSPFESTQGSTLAPPLPPASRLPMPPAVSRGSKLPAPPRVGGLPFPLPHTNPLFSAGDKPSSPSVTPGGGAAASKRFDLENAGERELVARPLRQQAAC